MLKKREKKLSEGKSKEMNQKENQDAAKGRFFTKNKRKTMEWKIQIPVRPKMWDLNQTQNKMGVNFNKEKQLLQKGHLVDLRKLFKVFKWVQQEEKYQSPWNSMQTLMSNDSYCKDCEPSSFM